MQIRTSPLAPPLVISGKIWHNSVMWPYLITAIVLVVLAIIPVTFLRRRRVRPRAASDIAFDIPLRGETVLASGWFAEAFHARWGYAAHLVERAWRASEKKTWHDYGIFGANACSLRVAIRPDAPAGWQLSLTEVGGRADALTRARFAIQVLAVLLEHTQALEAINRHTGRLLTPENLAEIPVHDLEAASLFALLVDIDASSEEGRVCLFTHGMGQLNAPELLVALPDAAQTADYRDRLQHTARYLLEARGHHAVPRMTGPLAGFRALAAGEPEVQAHGNRFGLLLLRE